GSDEVSQRVNECLTSWPHIIRQDRCAHDAPDAATCGSTWSRLPSGLNAAFATPLSWRTTPLRTNRSRVPESELTAPRAARSSLKPSSSTHYMGQDAMAVFAHGRARRLPRQYRCLTAPASQPGALFPALLPLARPRQPLHFVAIPTTKEER